MNTRRLTAIIPATALACMMLACSDRIADLGDRPARIDIEPELVVLVSTADSAMFSAQVFNYNGQAIALDVTWSSADENVATVNDRGVVRAVANGRTWIRAVNADVAGLAEVEVQLAQELGAVRR